MSRSRQPERAKRSLSIPEKANWVLNLVLIGFLLIVLRIWYLTIVQHDSYEERARRPQKRTVVEPAKRGTIRDRFNLPLAINRMQYNAAIVYAPLKQIPAVQWKVVEGKKVKTFPRKEYIKALAELLGNKLSLDKGRIEDLIYSKGALYNRSPFVIKEDISEQEYYALRILEREWPGVEMQKVPRRYYPHGKVAGDVVGYLGAINRVEYEKIMQEMAFLEEQLKASSLDDMHVLPEGFTATSDIRQRLQELQEKSYTLTDSVGKAGVEARYERELRGKSGRKSFYADARGNFLKELPGSRAPRPGRRILLSISLELQAYAEQLLIQNEQIRQTRATQIENTKHKFMQQQPPWIKGGAIVAMDPHSGEILAMASVPRYDPNDFILAGNLQSNRLKSSHIHKWFETEEHIGELFDQKCSLEREVWNPHALDVQVEKKKLSWQNFLESILPHNSPVAQALLEKVSLAEAVAVGASVERLMLLAPDVKGAALLNALYPLDVPHGKEKVPVALPKEVVASELKILNPFLASLPENYDKLLFIDLCRLAVDHSRFTAPLLAQMGSFSLSYYRDLSAGFVQVSLQVCEMSKELFRDHHFTAWRKDNEKSFLAGKRQQEKLQKKYARPYIDLLDQKERELFAHFWQQYRWILLKTFITGHAEKDLPDELALHLAEFKTWQREIDHGAHPQLPWVEAYKLLEDALVHIESAEQIPFLQTFRSYRELERPLIGRYPHLREVQQVQREKHLAAAFYPKFGMGYGRSHAYRQATTQGSLFKLVTAYEAMRQHNGLHAAEQENLFEMTDKVFTMGKEVFVGYDASGKPLPRFYRGGRLPRSTGSNFGKMNVVRAIELSSNPYFALLAGDLLQNPSDLGAAAKAFSYGSRTGIDLPGEIAGKIPGDLETNRTGLYAMAIGQHSLVVTPLQTCLMLSAIANGGKILTPKIGLLAAGSLSARPTSVLDCGGTFPYCSSLKLVGIDYPLFLAVDSSTSRPEAKKFPTLVKHLLPIPLAIRNVLLEGMYRVVQRSQKEGLPTLQRIYASHPEALSDYIALKSELLGKTSTAESIERLNLSKQEGMHIYNHIWFGGISFSHSDMDPFSFVVKDKYGTPELVVVVYLRFGGFGKESAPLAAQIVAKWREIKRAQASSTAQK